MTIAAIIALAFLLAGASGTAVTLALRIGGIKDEKSKIALDLAAAIGQRQTAEKQLQETMREFVTFRLRTDKQMLSLKKEILDLEKDLDQCTTPDSRRARLQRLIDMSAARGRDA